MQVEKRRNFIINFLYFLIIGIIAFAVAKYAVPHLAPFVVGFIIALIARGIIGLVKKYVKINDTLLRVIVLILMYALVVYLSAVVGVKFVVAIKDFFTKLPDLYTKEIQPAITNLITTLTQRFPNLQYILSESYQSINNTLLSFVEKASTTTINGITGVAGKVTGLVVKTVFVVISSVLFTLDLSKMENFLVKQMGPRTLHVYENVVENVGHTLMKFGKAYLIIICITYIELFIGLSILKVENAMLISMFIALVDILPVLGTGTVMIPWLLYSFIVGNTRMGFGLLILYAVIWIIRQAIEPKIVGDQIGLHPILTLLCIYLGGTLFGLFGLFALPIAVTIIKKLNDDKVINLFK